MDRFIEFQRFMNLESATDLIDILDQNGIPYEIDDSAVRFDLSATSYNPLEKQIVVKVKESDFEKASEISPAAVCINFTETEDEHFLYSFSDDDIVNIISNPEEWKPDEVELAKKIAKARSIQLTADKIKSARKGKYEEQKLSEIKRISAVKGGASWFLLIGLLSMVNSVAFIMNQKIFFIFGLGVTRLVDSIIMGPNTEYMVPGLFLNMILSGILVLFWHYARQEKSWAFLTGVIFYGLDTLIFIFLEEWLSAGFHIFVLLIIGAGYYAIQEKNKNLQVMQSDHMQVGSSTDTDAR